MIRNLQEDEFKQKERAKIVYCVWQCPNLDMTLIDPDDTHIWAPSRCVAEDPAGQRKWAKAPPSRHQNEYLIQPWLGAHWLALHLPSVRSTDTCSLLSNFSSSRLCAVVVPQKTYAAAPGNVSLSSCWAFPRLTKDRFIQHPVQYSVSLGFYFQDFLAPCAGTLLRCQTSCLQFVHIYIGIK